MIRPSIAEDVPALITLANTIGFQDHELNVLREMLDSYFNSGSASECFWITDEEDDPVGVAYCEPERMTDRAWNLQLIAIHPDRQRQGRGSALLHYIEQALIARGGRMLLVETSSLPEFERTREFYKKCGYEEEARIRDFYTTGDHKVVFRKVLL